MATKNGWERYSSKNNSFTIAGYFKPTSETSDVLHVYIEGDGAPWLYPWLPPENPTPYSPISLHLALNDPHPNVLYLARPCQLTRGYERNGCHVDFWTNARFSTDVIESTNTSITRFLNSIKANKLILFGYSGGGSVAALVAAYRNDILGIVTVAGTLDHEAWTTYHKVSPLSHSLNPINFGKELSKIPQIHFIGDDDKIMPNIIAESYLKSLDNKNKTKLLNINNYDHSCCWVDNWEKLLLQVNFIN